MDEILIVPKISTYTFGPEEIKKYQETNHVHPYMETSVSHPTQEGFFNHHFVNFELFINRRCVHYSVNSDVLFYNIKEWYDSYHQCSNFHPFAVYLDETIYQQPVSFKCFDNFIVWDILFSDIQTLKITNKSQLIFNRTQYENSIKTALERLFILPEITNIPAEKIFLPDDENLIDFKERLLEKNI